MKLKDIKIVNVTYCNENKTTPVGRLAIKDRQVLFEYEQEFLEMGLDLSPLKLPLKQGTTACNDMTFEGLFGVFNDSLPDGWGRLLLDRKLLSIGINPDSLTPLDRLCYVGQRGMGALKYEPALDDSDPEQHAKNLDVIANECLQFRDHHDDKYIDSLMALNGSSAGARPKILVRLPNSDTTHNDWIIKFPSSLDPRDIGPIEYAYHRMAIEAGLEVPESKLFPSKTSEGYFGVKRFDKSENGVFHMHTASGLLHSDHRLPSMDYDTLIKATHWLTKNVGECEKQYRHAVFNICAHNRDDHSKNFSFLMNEDGSWRVSPAYDLTFSSGPGGEHCSSIFGEGKNPEMAHLLKLAEVAGVSHQKAMEIIDQVRTAISKWSHISKESFVSRKSSDRIQKSLNLVLKNK